MATAYLEPNLNNPLLGGAKSQLNAGVSDRTMAGPVDRVLKVFHHFEINTEQNFWSTNVRYGDATDVRVRRPHLKFLMVHIADITRLGMFYQRVGLCSLFTSQKHKF